MTNPTQSSLLGSLVVDNSPGLTTAPAALHTLWWGLGSGREALIRVANASSAAVVADVYLDFQGVHHPSPALNFAPFETKVLSVVDLLGALSLSPAQAPEGGLSIVARGPAPTLIAQGRITDATTGFSTPLHFPDLSFHRASALHANGLPLGVPSTDSPYAGTGTYTPHIIARNLTGSPQSIVPTLEYPGANGPAQSTLAALTLAPYATMDIPLGAALALVSTPVPHAAIGIQYSGAPGSVIAEVASIEQRGELVVSSYAQNEGNNYAGSGAYAWHLDDQTESMLYLSNSADHECPIGLQVQANGVPYYVTDLRLKAHETRAISLRQLRDAQKADFQGHKIPAGATDGTVLWTRLTNDPVTGQLDVVSNGELVTPETSSSCCCPPNYQGLSVTAQSSSMAIDGPPLPFKATLATMDCNGNYYYSDWTTLVTWSSSATNIATVNSTTGVVTAVSAGTTNIIANGSCWEQYMCCAGVCNPCACVPVEGGTTLTVADGTPVITSISNTEWPVGATTIGVIISGHNFGTSPIVSFSDPAVTCTESSAGDTQITCNITVGVNASGGAVNVTVTSQGYNGSGFIPLPNGGSQATSGSYPASKLKASFIVRFSGNKNTADLLQFNAKIDCSQSLGLHDCSGYNPPYWLWNVEIEADVSDDASNWTVSQNAGVSGSGDYISSGTQYNFTDYVAQGPDPGLGPTQQTPGTKTIFWLDAGGRSTTQNGYYIDSVTDTFDLTSKVCSKIVPTYCASVQWYVIIVVDPGKVLDSAKSSAGYGNK
jgi:hypothetical protein